LKVLQTGVEGEAQVGAGQFLAFPFLTLHVLQPLFHSIQPFGIFGTIVPSSLGFFKHHYLVLYVPQKFSEHLVSSNTPPTILQVLHPSNHLAQSATVTLSSSFQLSLIFYLQYGFL